MTHTAILDRVSGIVGDVLALDDVALTTAMTAADVEGWDSLANVQIIVAIERAFKIRFRSGEIAAIRNVGELVSRIAELTVSPRDPGSPGRG